MPKKSTSRTQKQLVAENEDLRARLDEAEETLRAIRSGEVDALVVSGVDGEQVFTLKGADHSYRILIEDMSEGALTMTAEGVILYANRRFAEMLKTPLEKVIGSTIHTWIAPDSQRILQSLLRKGADGKPREQLVLAAGDGTLVPVYLSVSNLPIYETSDSLCLVATDLTEQKRSDAILASEKLAQELLAASNQSRLELQSVIEERKLVEKALRENEEKYRSLVESTQDSIYVVDRNGTYLFINKWHLSRLGVSEDSGKTYQELHSASDTQEFIRKVGEVFASNEPVRHEHKSRRDGRHFIRTLSPIIGADGRTKAITVVSTDITDRVRAEEEQKNLQVQLQRAQKMEAMGLMAGGVAHDLNNILSGIVSYPELLLMDLPEDSPMRRPIETMQESGMRAADVVADLLTIARGVSISKEPLNLNTMIEQYLNSPEHKKLEKTHSFVEFKTDLDADLLNMRGSPTHIKKTLMNLIANATEAIEGSGTVTICTKNRYVDEPLKGYENVRIGEYTVVSISDDGAGISREDIERIFEPFYTKKMMGRSGTGLGLAVVWNTVQDHNGYINVNTSEKGTVFELYFPVTRDEVPDKKKQVPLKDYLGHGEKILVVDDEERQREIAGELLTRLGYVAEAVSSGEEAIEYVKEQPVDLIVLDMVMPKGINGRKTYEEIIKIRPGQKAIIASGYAKTKEVDTAQELGAGKYIKKPYVLEKIGVAVKEELEK